MNLAKIIICFCFLSANAATISVSNNNDSGAGSLRTALQADNDVDTIRANAGIGVIQLASPLPLISKNITIDVVSGTQEINANNHRSFVIESGKQ